MVMDTSKVKTAADLIEYGVKPTTAKENLVYSLEKQIGALRLRGLDGEDLYSRLYPNTVVPNTTVESLTRALIAGIDVLLFGPPGTGKTTLVDDLINLFPKFTYIVEGCEYFQCSPFSLTDAEFFTRVKPCPVCKSRYGGDAYKETRLFDPRNVRSEDVKIRFAYLSDGFGISRIMGTADTFPQDLTGVINLRKLEEIGDPFHREVFTPGKIPQGNNGFVYLNEIGKIPSRSQSALLDAMQEKEVKPANTREPVPSSAVYLCDTNIEDLDKIISPLNDRVIKIHFGYNPTLEGNRRIIRRAVYGTKAEVEPLDYMEVWRANKTSLLEVPIPTPLENSIAAFMVAYRGSQLSDRQVETESNRVMIEAVKLARANAKLAGRVVADDTDITIAVSQSVLGRIRPRTEKQYVEDRDKLVDYAKTKIKEKMKEVSYEFWCEFQEKHPKIGSQVLGELDKVEKRNGWQDVINNAEGLKQASTFWDFVKEEHPYVPKPEEVQAALLRSTYKHIKANLPTHT